MSCWRKFQVAVLCLAIVVVSAACSHAGLIAKWSGEGNAMDSAGAHHGTLLGGVGFAPGVVGQAFSLDGVDDWIDIGGDESDFDIAGKQFSVEFWISGDPTQREPLFSVIDKGHGGIPSGWAVASNWPDPPSRFGTLAFMYGDGSDYQFGGESKTTVADNKWHYFVGTWDGRVMSIYIDGKLSADQTNWTLPLDNNLPVEIGSWWGGGGGRCRYFRGLLDEIAFYDVALTPEQVMANYESASLIAKWRAEGDALDSVGNHHGTIIGGITYAPGVIGQAFSFDGVDDVIDIGGDESDFDIAGREFSVELWAKPDSNQPSPDYHFEFIDKQHGYEPGAYKGWLLQDRHDWHPCGSTAFLYGDGNSFPGAGSTVPTLNDRWHHVVGTWDGTRMNLYIDGDCVGGSCPSTSPLDNDRPVEIGAFVDGAGVHRLRYFKGLMDEIACYRKALTPEQVRAHYLAQKPPDPPIAIAGKMLVAGTSGILEDSMYYLQGSSDNIVPSPVGGDLSPLGGQATYTRVTQFRYETGAILASDIFKAKTDGSQEVNLTAIAAMEGSNCNPSWSPDGSKIAFIHSDPVPDDPCYCPCANSKLWVMNANGTGAHEVASAPLWSGPPSWTSDGDRLLFTRLSSYDAEIFEAMSVSLDGTNLQVLVVNAAYPMISSDGAKLIFQEQVKLACGIGLCAGLVVANADGSSPQWLKAEAATYDELSASGYNAVMFWNGVLHPIALSPTGDQVVYRHTTKPFDPLLDGYKGELWVHDTDISSCSGSTQITSNNLVWETSVSWRDPSFAVRWMTPLHDGTAVTSPDGPFKRGRTIPVKFQLFDAQGRLVPDVEAEALVARLQVFYEQPCNQGEPTDPGDNPPDISDQFRYQADEDMFIYNLSTKDPAWLADYTYGLEVLITDISGLVKKAGEVYFSLR